MKNQWIILVAVISFAACKNSITKKESEKESSFLPVTDFIREDIKRVDSFAGGILLKTTVDSKMTDSAFIQPEEFKNLAYQFLMPELDSAIFQTQFSETSLMDETTQMLNFIYSSTNNKTALRKVIVYVSPSLTTDKVARIYMEKESTKGDSTISQKLTWKMRQYLIIAEIIQTPGGYSATRIRKAIWDPQQFTDQ